MKITHQIIELGTVTDLTLGTGIYGFENRYTPVGVSVTKPHATHVVELGTVTNLTLGGGPVGFESFPRPARK